MYDHLWKLLHVVYDRLRPSSYSSWEQAVYAAGVNQTVGDVLATEKEWRDKREADKEKK